MKVVQEALSGILVLEINRFADARGYFSETFRDSRYAEVGIPTLFKQDNISFSSLGTLRGMHFQNPHSQGKLVSVLSGSVFDVAVDLRKSSPHFGKWFGQILSEKNRLQMYVPVGFAHGFLTLEDNTFFQYKCTEVYHPQSECSIHWNDPTLKIEWPKLGVEPQLSAKDELAVTFKELNSQHLFS